MDTLKIKRATINQIQLRLIKSHVRGNAKTAKKEEENEKRRDLVFRLNSSFTKHDRLYDHNAGDSAMSQISRTGLTKPILENKLRNAERRVIELQRELAAAKLTIEIIKEAVK